MKNSFAIALLAASSATALNIGQLLGSLGPAPDDDPRFTNFQPPGAGDVRSPCPGLNTLANHGFINHNGRGMTIPILLKGLAAGMNIGPDFSTAVGAAGLLASPNPLGGSFDLNQLDQHNFPIEHDASLSRQDAFFGNDYSFNNQTWQQFITHFDGKTFTDITTEAVAKFSRTNDSINRNPQLVYGPRAFIFSYGETGLYTQTMSSPNSNGVARVDFIRSLFEQQKLPYELGWRVSQSPITLQTLGDQLVQLFAANPEKLPEGVVVASDSYKEAFVELVGGSEVLANLTQGISSALGL